MNVIADISAPTPAPRVEIKTVAIDPLIPPILDPMVQYYGRKSMEAARNQGLHKTKVEDPGMVSLLGYNGDRRVVGMWKELGKWQMGIVNVPSSLIKRIGLHPLSKAEPIWANLSSTHVGIFHKGEEHVLWDATEQLKLEQSSKPQVQDISGME